MPVDPSRQSPERGASLISALVACTVLSVLVLGGREVLLYYVQAINKMVVAGEQDDLRRLVLSLASCPKTISTAEESGACDGKGPVRIFDDNCRQLSNVAFADGGGMALRATCQRAPRGPTGFSTISVEFRRDARESTWKNLFDGIPLACTPGAGGVGTIDMGNRKSIDNFLRTVRSTSRPDFPNFVTNGHTHNDAETASGVCKLRGCASVLKRVNRKYDSPGDNVMFFWSDAKDNFSIKGAKGNNNYLNGLICGNCSNGRVEPCRS